MFRLEIVSGKQGPEPIVWSFFPGLTPTAHSELYTIHVATSEEPLSPLHEGMLDGWVEEGDIVDWTCEEEPVPTYVGTNKASELTGMSASHWRNKAAAGRVARAYKSGNDWFIPMGEIEDHNRREKSKK